MNTAPVNDFVRFKDLVNEIKVAALITYSNADGLKGRPMSTASVDDQGELWFFTNEYSEKVQEIANDNKVLLSYASRSDNSYLIVRGKAVLVDDRAAMEALWSPILKVWFPEGLNDPAILLLKVQPEEVEFWDGSSNKIVVAFKMLKALITGKEYSDGEYKKITVNQE